MPFRYLNSLFLAIDANFRLKRRNISSEVTDPSFSDGWSYFVSEVKYKTHLQQFSDQIIQNVSAIVPCKINADICLWLQCSTCSNHNAVNTE